MPMGRLVALLFVACGAMPALGMLASDPGFGAQGLEPGAALNTHLCLSIHKSKYTV